MAFPFVVRREAGMDMQKEQIAMLVRTLVLFIALLNQLLMVFGYSILPLSEEAFGELFTAVFTAGAAIWAWCKDNAWWTL